MLQLAVLGSFDGLHKKRKLHMKRFDEHSAVSAAISSLLCVPGSENAVMCCSIPGADDAVMSLIPGGANAVMCSICSIPLSADAAILL